VVASLCVGRKGVLGERRAEGKVMEELGSTTGEGQAKDNAGTRRRRKRRDRCEPTIHGTTGWMPMR